MVIVTIKCVSGSSDHLKLAIFTPKNMILTFSEIFNFGWFLPVFPTLGSILGPQTCSDWPCHGASNGQGHPKEFFGLLWQGGLEQSGGSYRAKRQIFKKSNFGLKFLSYMRVPFELHRIMWYTHLDLRLGLRIFELATQRKTIGPWRPKSVAGHISLEP